jgi:hypothetical protein
MGNVPGSSSDQPSLGRKALIDDKVAAEQRGHGLGVSLEVYSISDLQQKDRSRKED